MKNLFYSLILGLLVLSCNKPGQKLADNVTQSDKSDSIKFDQDKKDMQDLIYQVLIWSDTCRTFDLYPAFNDKDDSLVIGLDTNLVNGNLTILRRTGFFTDTFIDNYKDIISTIDDKLQTGEIEWLVGDLPPFNYNMHYLDINPWCLCQGFSVDQFDNIDIIKIDSSVGNNRFKWTQGSDWVNFKFNVEKVDGKWRISYLEGFDFNYNK